MAKKKSKKIKNRKKINISKSKKKKRGFFGKRIKVREIKDQKSENLYGPVLELEVDEIENQEIFPEYNIAETEQNNYLYYGDKILQKTEAGQEKSLDNFGQIDITQPIEEENQNQLNENEPFKDLSLRQKNIILYVSISIIMLAIISFWFMGFKQSLSQSLKVPFLENTEQIEQSFNQVQSGISDLQAQINTQKEILIDVSEAAKQKIIEDQLKKETADKLRQKLLEDLKNLNSNLNLPNTNTQY